MCSTYWNFSLNVSWCWNQKALNMCEQLYWRWSCASYSFMIAHLKLVIISRISSHQIVTRLRRVSPFIWTKLQSKVGQLLSWLIVKSICLLIVKSLSLLIDKSKSLLIVKSISLLIVKSKSLLIVKSKSLLFIKSKDY